MPMRVTGLNSGLDTESIITALVEAKSEKKNKLVKAQTRLEWKQDAWKELNKKVYSFYTKTLSNMRMQGDYTKKITKSSNESAVSVITGSNAANGVQNLEVISQAKSGYLTGAELQKGGNKASYTSSTKLSEIDGLNLNGGEKLTIKVGGKDKEIALTGDMTINKLVSELRNAGVNANFDEKNQRFFISSKETGAANNFNITGDSSILTSLGLEGGDSNKIDGSDATIKLNGATFTSDSNTFEINGLTITVNQETSEKITLNTTDDTDGIYDMIKNFFKEYNELIIEMDSLYNAESSKGYEPLTDEEKEALSEKEIEKWEEKIKNSILRKDSTLNTVSSAIKQIMLQGVKMSDGSQLYLSEFGIGTLGYFNAGENEKSAYHIDGDPDDSNVSNNDDKLRAAIASDPDKVTEFFSTLSKNLYDKLFDMMKTTEYSSAFTLYDDKLMKEEYSSYTSKISKQEALIKAYEDRYYKKFAAMETALSKLQTKENALAGMFGG
ncbi:MAG: flagellar filament capping protein FliD [Lachnospiraceae bacterium]|nr:flagellar filament capping protein FliD [Lachnospiraceae bacterium]MDY4096441.1 flagellar filament capping protein FliD [Lachnospiraceae bacterium]